MSRRIAVTGAGGFIGAALVRALASDGHRVAALDLQPRPTDLPRTVEWIQGSVTDVPAIERLLAGSDCAIHLAFRMDLDGEDPLASAQTNLMGTINVFDAAARLGLHRVVWASSIMVYGPRQNYTPTQLTEKAEPMPRTPYGASKLALEWLARAYRQRGLETVALRLGTVFGPGRHRLGAAAFAVTLFEGPTAGRPVVIDEGDRTANLLYVHDAVEACVRAALAPEPLADVYNIDGFECTVADLAREVSRRLPAADIRVTPGGESPWPTAMDGRAATRHFGYRPAYDLSLAVTDYLFALGCLRTTSTTTGT